MTCKKILAVLLIVIESKCMNIGVYVNVNAFAWKHRNIKMNANRFNTQDIYFMQVFMESFPNLSLWKFSIICDHHKGNPMAF